MALLSYFVAAFTLLVAVASCGRIDTHFHALPAPYVQALKSNGGDASGYATPDWSIEAAIQSMDEIGTQLGVLSVSSPGVPIAGTGQPARDLARTLNNQLGSLSSNSTAARRVGFFGVLPDFQDIEGTLSEIDYIFGQQKLTVGVTIYTSYGGKLLGHPDFVPIWTKLQSYKALVFLHPSVLDVQPFFIGAGIPQPIVDYPLATTRAAVDLVMTGTIRACPDVDIILSHAGGTVPFVGSRAVGSLAIQSVATFAKVDLAEAEADFRRFYYDIALSTSSAQLDGLLDFAQSDRILFGSDFPYAPEFAIKAVVDGYDKFVSTNSRGSQIRAEVLRNNAVELLQRHSFGNMNYTE